MVYFPKETFFREKVNFDHWAEYSVPEGVHESIPVELSKLQLNYDS